MTVLGQYFFHCKRGERKAKIMISIQVEIYRARFKKITEQGVESFVWRQNYKDKKNDVLMFQAALS